MARRSFAVTEASSVPLAEAGYHQNEGDSRVLRAKRQEYDVIVVSMGGTGCSNLLAKLGKITREARNKYDF